MPNSKLSFAQNAAAPGYIKIGGIMIQWGGVGANSSGTSITFPIPFSAPPKMGVNLSDPGSWDARAYNISATGCLLRQGYTSSNLEVQWIAIGPV